jgi:hypothetical protein
MSQPNVRSEKGTGTRSGGRGGIASKSQEAAEFVEGAVADRVEQVRNQADSAKEQTVERIRRVAGHLRQMSETLRTDDTVAAGIAERASRGVESIANYVGSTDARSILSDTEQLARRKPTLFYGGAFVLGLAAARFLKSSRPDNYGSRSFDDRDRSWRDEPGGYDASERDQGRSQERSSGFYGNAYENGTTGSARRGTRGSSEERFRQNYDAAFGRDSSEYERNASSGSSTIGGGVSTPMSENKSTPGQDNGGTSGKGSSQ